MAARFACWVVVCFLLTNSCSACKFCLLLFAFSQTISGNMHAPHAHTTRTRTHKHMLNTDNHSIPCTTVCDNMSFLTYEGDIYLLDGLSSYISQYNAAVDTSQEFQRWIICSVVTVWNDLQLKHVRFSHYAFAGGNDELKQWQHNNIHYYSNATWLWRAFLPLRGSGTVAGGIGIVSSNSYDYYLVIGNNDLGEGRLYVFMPGTTSKRVRSGERFRGWRLFVCLFCF